MLNLKRLFLNKTVRYILIIAAFLILVYIVLRLTVFPSDPVIPLLNSLYKIYLLVPEAIANLLFKAADAGVAIRDHQLIFENTKAYHTIYSKFIENWPVYLLHKTWSTLIMVLVWITLSPVRKKLLFTLFFIITHLISVVGGLYLMGAILPGIIDEQTGYTLSPTSFGNLLLFVFLLAWVMFHKREIINTLHKLRINITLTDKKLNEIIVLLFFLFVLRDYLIPYLAFKPYVHFLLETTRRIVSIFNFTGYISGDQLIGQYGALALSKHCLGFMTMYIFTALVYLTRPKDHQKATWLFIASGLVFLMILNIVRLVVLFIIAQGENGIQRAESHHEIYNAIIYIFIFVMWVIWFELVRRRFRNSQEHG